MEDAENLLRDSKLFSPSSSVGSYGIREEDLDDDWCSNNRSFNFNELIDILDHEGGRSEPWTRRNYKLPEIPNYKGGDANADEKATVLSDRLIASSSGYLGFNEFVKQHVICNLKLNHKNLTDIGILKFHHYLQYLDLSWNHLDALEPLNQLPFLIHLDVSHNRLPNLLDFTAPLQLGYADFSHNCIDKMPDLTQFWSLVTLDVSSNSIAKINGIQNLRYLQNLNIASNHLTSIDGINRLNLMSLQLQNNRIRTPEEKSADSSLRTLEKLVYVNLSNNQITSLAIFKGAYNLEQIDLSDNKVSDLFELTYLCGLQYLVNLDLTANPVTARSSYAEACMKSLRSLTVLDGNVIDLECKVHIMNKHDPAKLIAVYDRYAKAVALEQIESYEVRPFSLPLGETHNPLVLLVGPPGSDRGRLAREYCFRNSRLVRLGVTHTSRAKLAGEVDGHTYYFVSDEKLQEMSAKGELISIWRKSGCSYGFAYSELRKLIGPPKIMICNMNLPAALAARRKVLQALIVLGVTETEESYREMLSKKYSFQHWNKNYSGISKIIKYKDRLKPKTSSEAVTAQVLKKVVRDVYKRNGSDDSISSWDTLNSSSANRRIKIRRDDVSTISSSSRESEVVNKKKLYWTSPRFSENPTSARTSANPTSPRLSVTFQCPDETPNIQEGNTEYTARQKSGKDTSLHSVSETTVMKSSETGHLLSVLSRLSLESCYDDEMETNDGVELFLGELVSLRRIYLQMHQEQPGLFNRVIFTDDIEDAIENLDRFIRWVRKSLPPLEPTKYRIDSAYRALMADRFRIIKRDIHRSMFVTTNQPATMTHPHKRSMRIMKGKQKTEIMMKMNRAHRRSIYFALPTEGKLAPQVYTDLL